MPVPEELTADERTRLERFDCAPADMAKLLRIHDQQRVHIDNLDARIQELEAIIRQARAEGFGVIRGADLEPPDVKPPL